MNSSRRSAEISSSRRSVWRLRIYGPARIKRLIIVQMLIARLHRAQASTRVRTLQSSCCLGGSKPQSCGCTAPQSTRPAFRDRQPPIRKLPASAFIAVNAQSRVSARVSGPARLLIRTRRASRRQDIARASPPCGGCEQSLEKTPYPFHM